MGGEPALTHDSTRGPQRIPLTGLGSMPLGPVMHYEGKEICPVHRKPEQTNII